jgi:hypothetical protein
VSISRSSYASPYALDRALLAGLAARLGRRMEFTLTVAERNLYVSLGEETLQGVIERVEVGKAPGG